MITLVAATVADIPSMWTVRTRALRTQSAGHYAAEVLARWTSWPAPDSYPRLLSAGGGVLALDDGRIAGYAILDAGKACAAQPAGNTGAGANAGLPASAEVDAIFVDPDYAGRGIGKQLLRALEIMLPGAPLHLYASLNAVPFYQSAGFRPLERTQYEHPSGLQLDCVHMAKP